jgi:neuroglobin
MFETNADIRTLFAGIKHLKTAADLRNSKLLEAHAMKVICTIDDAITNLDDMDYVIKMLQLSAQSHYARQPSFDPNYFWVCNVCQQHSLSCRQR